MSVITSNFTHCTIGSLNQYYTMDGNNGDQQITRIIKTINNCDGPIYSFTGRGTELSALSSAFNKHNIVVIHGVGGVGKTQLAKKFAADNKNNYNCLYWLQAEIHEQLIKLLRELAIALAIKDAKDKNINQIRNAIYEILKTQRALLIFDNVLNEADIVQYLPPFATELKNTKLHILITSQYQDWNPDTRNCLPLNQLHKIHALELLDKILKLDRANAKDKEDLVGILEYMPLAIQIAASYINSQTELNKAFTITRYIEKLTDNAAIIHKSKHIEYGKTLALSINMSLDIIRDDKSHAKKLLYVMAFLNPDSITIEVLFKILQIYSKDAEEACWNALKIIINYSLISSIDNRLYLHRNIQNIIRDDLTQLEADIFLKYYKLVLDYILNNEDQNSIRNSYVFKYAKDNTEFILQYYETSKSAKLLRLLCAHGCLKNVKVIFKSLSRNEVNFLIKQHGLLHCTILSNDIETVKEICKYKIDINMKHEFDNVTSLHIACMHGYVDIADFLINKGADTNRKCENGCIALHYACIGLHYDIVCRLLHISPNTVEERDKKNQTPLQLVLNTHQFRETNDKTLEIARLLVEKGANPDTANDELYKVIHIAAHNGKYDFLAYLLKNYELDVNVKNKYGYTPLPLAVAAGKFISKDHIMNTLKLLIKNGASVETITNDGCSLLHVAAEFCCDQIISYLIQEHKISIHKTDKFGRAPLFYALLANKSIPEDNVLATVKLLIENGASVDTIINNGSNLLHIAANYCRDQIITYLIQEHKKSVDSLDSSGLTPLFYALYANKSIPEDDVMATVKLLIENGASEETIINYGSNLLHRAALYCRDQIISYLIEEHNISVDLLDSSGLTPLFHALLANKSIPEDDVMATVQLLIENGVSAETIANDGSNLLHRAAEYCRDQIITYLIEEHNISVDSLNSSGLTPLFHALLANKSIPEDNVLATVKLLIKNGASAETIINDGSNLLHVAAENCRDQIIIYLIEEHKKSVDLLDSSGLTPLFYALYANKSIPEDDVMATVKLLIENCASAKTITNDSCSLLHVAAENCRDQIIIYLIQEHNLFVDTPDSSGRTPLFYALLANNSILEDVVTDTMKLLIARGATVEATDNIGSTILHYAAQCGRYQALSYLLHNYTININTKDEDGDTPLHDALLANKSKNQETVKKIIEILLHKGASINLKNNTDQTALDLASAEVREFMLKSYTTTS